MFLTDQLPIRAIAAICLLSTVGCSDLRKTGHEPEFTPPQANSEHAAMMDLGLPASIGTQSTPLAAASLWAGDRASLLGDRRAMQRGDIMTVVIEINDSAQISNSSNRGRTAQQSMTVPNLFGIPQRIDQSLPDGASMSSAVDIGSSSTASGNGSVSRNEKLTLRVAATIIDVMPNGILSIQGSQEVRVNFELRELWVSGFVRPEDVTRQNEITYDKIASARISYGGRGQITDMQQPRYGQQIADSVLPF